MGPKCNVIFSILPIVFLAACVAPAAVTPTLAQPGATLSPQPSSRPASSPTQTESPKNTATSTSDTTEEIEPTIQDATLNAMETLDAVPDTACDATDSNDGKFLSPDGQWIALVCRLNTTTRATNTKVFRLDGTALWNVPFYETYGRFHEFQDGVMRIYHWSKDGNFAYLIPSFCCADAPQDIFFNYFQTGVGLYRLDLKSGKLNTVLPPETTSVFPGYAFSFSPSDKYLAYLGPKNLNEINVSTFKSGNIEKISLNKYDFCGNFKWSADSKKLAFICGIYETDEKTLYAYLWVNTTDWIFNLLTKKEGYPGEISEMRWTEENDLIVIP
jgi:hypothetical protein